MRTKGQVIEAKNFKEEMARIDTLLKMDTEYLNETVSMLKRWRHNQFCNIDSFLLERVIKERFEMEKELIRYKTMVRHLIRSFGESDKLLKHFTPAELRGLNKRIENKKPEQGSILRDEECPRCIEDWTDDDGVEQKGTNEISDCSECGVCKECEHLIECSKSN